MLEFEKACTRMGITLEAIDLQKGTNSQEASLVHREQISRCSYHDGLRLSCFYNIAFISASILLFSAILFVPASREKLDLITLTSIVAILLVGLVSSIVSLIKNRLMLHKFTPSRCEAFRLTCNPASLEDIANGVLLFRVLERHKDVFMHTDDFLVLARDGAVPYLISYSSKDIWANMDFRHNRLLTEVLNDVE